MNLSPITWAKAKDTLSRAAWTFVQAFASAFVLPPVAQFGSLSTWKVAAFASLAAALSAVKSLLVNAAPSSAVTVAQAKTPPASVVVPPPPVAVPPAA